MATTRMITIILCLWMVMFHSPGSGSGWPQQSSHRILIEIALINPLDHFNNVWLQLLSPLDCNLDDLTIVDPKTQVLILLPANYPKFSPPPTIAFLPANQKPTYIREIKRRYHSYLSSLPVEMRRFLIDVDPCKHPSKHASIRSSEGSSQVTANDLQKLHGYIQRQNDKLRKEYQYALENMAEAYLQLEQNVKTLTATVRDVEVSLEKSRKVPEHPTRNTLDIMSMPKTLHGEETEEEEPDQAEPQPIPTIEPGQEPDFELYFQRIKDWIQRFDAFWIILITFCAILATMFILLSLLTLVLLCCHQAATVHGAKNRPSAQCLQPRPQHHHQYHLLQKAPEAV